jgi:hypothetical protein
VRALPILLVFGAMFYWLWRVRRRAPPVLIRNEAMAPAVHASGVAAVSAPEGIR